MGDSGFSSETDRSTRRQFGRAVAGVTAGAFAGITPFKPKVEQQEPLRAELTSFLRAVRERSSPEVTLEDGRQALALATQIVDAIAEHSRRTNLLQLTRAGS